jgi:hypothetical protein
MVNHSVTTHRDDDVCFRRGLLSRAVGGFSCGLRPHGLDTGDPVQGRHDVPV